MADSKEQEPVGANYNSFVEQPDYSVIVFDKGNFGLGDDSSIAEKRVAMRRFVDNVKSANWWEWDTSKWEIFLSENKRIRDREGENYQGHEFERILVEYGKWCIENPHEDEFGKFWKIQTLNIYYFMFWRRGEEVPQDIYSDI